MAVAKEDTIRPMTTERMVSKDPPEDSKACDDELDPSDCKVNDDDELIDMTTEGSDKPTASVTVDKKLPPCPYGKKCYR